MLRPPRPDDRERIVELIHTAERAEAGVAISSPADVDDLLATPNFDLVTRARLQLDADRATAFVAVHPAPQPGELRAHLILAPAAVADAPKLLALIAEWSAQSGTTAAPVTTTLFELPGFPARGALIEAGWEVVHSYTRMRASLDAQRRPRLPAAVTIRPAATLADMAVVHAVLEDAVSGHWKHQRRPFADFLEDQHARAGHDPALWLLAEFAGEPAGGVIARDPPDRAWIGWLGVHPDYRRRGIAEALLRTVFEELRRRGQRVVGVDVDTHNDTKAGLVYARAGMTVVGRADQWSKTFEPLVR